MCVCFSLLQKNPDERMSLDDVINDPFVQKHLRRVCKNLEPCEEHRDMYNFLSKFMLPIGASIDPRELVRTKKGTFRKLEVRRSSPRVDSESGKCWLLCAGWLLLISLW